jgi:O-acetyl-ADP-ribose deacetylase
MIRLVIGDITKLQVDAIVNAANSQLVPGGGVDGAIHQAAGPGLFSELKTHHTFLQPGEAILTAGYRLPAKHVIHTVAPRWIPGLDNQTEILSDCYRNSIRLALENDFESIAFPALGTGAFGIPKEIAMATALSAIALQLQRSGPELDVTICCYTEADYQLYVEAVSNLGGDVLDDGTLLINQLLPKCPICFHPLKRIVYGMPSPGMLENQDNIYIGGCIIMGGDPEIGCKNCDWKGFIGDVDLVDGEWVALVVDLGRKRFVAGAIYDAGQPRSALMLTPGIPEFQRGFTNEWLEEHIANCQEPSVWLGNRNQIMPEAFEKILMRYPRLTAEVMEFARFQLVDNSPEFSRE